LAGVHGVEAVGAEEDAVHQGSGDTVHDGLDGGCLLAAFGGAGEDDVDLFGGVGGAAAAYSSRASFRPSGVHNAVAFEDDGHGRVGGPQRAIR
jgi:hypothetical protein